MKWGRWLVVAAIVAALLVLVGVSRGGGDTERDVAQRAAASVPSLLSDHPRQAALVALASQRLDPSVGSELAMLAVATDHGGVERVIDTGGEVTAAIRMEHLLVTATSDGTLKVWRPADGTLLSEVRTERPLTSFADWESTPLLAGADDRGALSLIDLADPAQPRVRPLRASGGEPVLALSFASEATEVLALDAGGTLARVNVATGRRASQWSLLDAGGTLPWGGGEGGLELTAARFDIEAFSAENLVVATRDGAVAQIDVGRKEGETAFGADLAPGQVTTVDARQYEEPELVAGTTGGMVSVEKAGSEPRVQRGPAVTGVALDFSAGWIGDGEGVHDLSSSGYAGSFERLSGAPVLRLTEGAGGPVAIHPDGTVSLPGPLGSGLTMPEAESTAVATLDGGKLLVEEGSDANHVERLMTLRPGHAEEDGEYVANPEVRSYEPHSDWWPGIDEEEGGLYVSDTAMNEELVAAAGEDPLGDAVVLVWDAQSGRPLHRLSLPIGEVTSSEPSVAGDLILLPGRDRIAAYSTVQRLVAIWSTETWELLSTTPVGGLARLSASPDESRLVATAVPEDEGGYPDSSATKLLFIDVGDGQIEDEVRAPDAFDAAWSPDGDLLATIGEDGALRFRSADGEGEERPPIQLDDLPVSFAWRPDGKMIAVTMDDGGIVLVDPANGAISPALPAEAEISTFELSWSADGGLLAATTASEDESGEFFVPESPRIWTLSAARLQRRMCQIAGGPLSAAEWRRLVDADLPPRPLCLQRRAAKPENQVSEDEAIPEPSLVFRSGRRLFVADLDGRTLPIANVGTSPYARRPVSWSGDALGWSSPGQVGILSDGAVSPQVWPCECSGVAWHDGALYSVQNDGRALLRFEFGEPWPRSLPIHGSIRYLGELLGFLGDDAVVAGYDVAPTTSTLFLIDAQGQVERLFEARGSIERRAADSSGETIAFAGTTVGTACGPGAQIGVLSRDRRGEVQVAYPPLPGDGARSVASVQVRDDGTVEAAIAPAGCVGGGPPDEPLEATRYRLREGSWVATGDRGQDVQGVGDVAATLRPGEPAGEGTDLVLSSADGEEIPVATAVEEMAARP